MYETLKRGTRGDCWTVRFITVQLMAEGLMPLDAFGRGQAILATWCRLPSLDVCAVVRGEDPQVRSYSPSLRFL